jgi:hypothetical protein
MDLGLRPSHTQAPLGVVSFSYPKFFGSGRECLTQEKRKKNKKKNY